MPGSAAERWNRIEKLTAELEAYPDPAIRKSVQELLGSVMALYSDALGRLVEGMDEPRLRDLAQLPEVGGVLLLHGLHPDDLRSRIEQALEKVRPSLKSHRGDVELLEIVEPNVRLKLVGTCNGCPSSATTFRNLLEAAILEAAPEIEEIEVDGMVVHG